MTAPAMNDFLLSAKNLSVRFGGVLAVNDVSFDVKQGEVFHIDWPQWRRQDHGV